MKIFLLVPFLILLACSAFGKSRKDTPSIKLDPQETLHVQVIDNVWHGSGNVGMNDRFRRIKNTLEEVLEEVDFPMEIKIERFGANKTPAYQPRLDLTIMKWGNNGMSEIEVRFSASLKLEYDRNKLGVFYHRGGAAFGTSDQVIRVHDEILRKGLVEMVSELNQRLVYPTPVAEEEISVGGEGGKEPGAGRN